MNKIIWGAVFFIGAGVFGWLEWGHANEPNSWLWFLETSLWSGACGIGYSIGEWFGGRKE